MLGARYSYLFVLIVVYSLSSCDNDDNAYLQGSWEVNKIRLSGSNRTSYFSHEIKWITFEEGHRCTIASEEQELPGRWHSEAGKLTLLTPEIKDIHGTIITPKQRSQWAFPPIAVTCTGRAPLSTITDI